MSLTAASIMPTAPPAPAQPPAPGPPIGRHPRDLVVLCLAAAVVVLCAFAALTPLATPVEAAVFVQLQQLPAVTTVVWKVLFHASGWLGVAAVTATVLYLKRIRLGVQVAAAALVAWGLAHLVGRIVGTRPVVGDLLDGIRLPGPEGFAFPATHAVVAAAMVALVSPYLKTRWRRLAWALVVLAGAAEVYLGTNLPLGVIAGVMLGWGVGAFFHLVLGAPGRRTSGPAVRWALEQAGIAPVAIVPLRARLTGPLEFVVLTETGERLRVDVVRRLQRRAGPLHRLQRLLASMEVEDEPRLSSPYHETEHEALVTLFAQRAGVRTPQVLLTCETKHGTPLLVRREIAGQRLSGLPAEQIDDPLLDAIWAQLAALGAARIAHNDMRAKNILVDPDGSPWLLDFAFGRIGAGAGRTAQDLAETLVALASRVGVERAVRSAVRSLSADELEPALAYLNVLALPRSVRAQLEQCTLTELREVLAEEIDRPIPTMGSPVRPSTVVGLLLLGAAVYVLAPQLSSMREVVASLGTANIPWLVIATATGLLAIVPAAVSVMGSSPTALPFWRTTTVQFAAAFTGRTTPGGVGFFGINIAFLERLGLRRATAFGVTALNLTATAVVGGLLTVLGLLAVGISSLPLNLQIPWGWPLFAGVGGAVVLTAGLLASPFGRRRIVEPSVAVARELLGTLTNPVRAVQLFGGAVVHLVISALGLAASLAAFGAPVPVLAVVVVFLLGHLLGHIAPIPGGLGPTEAIMIGGLTAIGTAPTVAVASVLASRLLTYWLPVLPGIAAFRWLQHRGVI